MQGLAYNEEYVNNIDLNFDTNILTIPQRELLREQIQNISSASPPYSSMRISLKYKESSDLMWGEIMVHSASNSFLAAGESNNIIHLLEDLYDDIFFQINRWKRTRRFHY